MATITALSAISADDTNTTTYAGTAGTPNTSDALVCFVFIKGTVSSTPTMTGGGWSWSLLTQQSIGSGTGNLYVFIAFTTGTTSTSPTVAFSGAGTAAIIHCYRVASTGGTGSVYVRQFKSSAAISTTISVTMDAAILTGNPVLGAAGHFTNNATLITPPTSWTEGGEIATATDTLAMETATRTSGETGTTITWGFTGTVQPQGAVVVELYNTGTGPTTVTPMIAYGDGYFGEVYLR